MTIETTEAKWMTSDEAQEYLRIGKTKFYSLLYSGKLPSYRIGRAHRLRRADLDAFVEANRYRPGG